MVRMPVYKILTRLGVSKEVWWLTSIRAGTEIIFRDMLEKCKPIHTCLEIGTNHGAATSLLALYSDMVYTIDILSFNQEIREKIWKAVGVENKIVYKIIKSSFDKANYLNKINFDFAFIDGSHMMESIEFDFQLTKKCGRLLFHDYANNWKDVKIFVDGLNKDEWLVDVKGAFALALKR